MLHRSGLLVRIAFTHAYGEGDSICEVEGVRRRAAEGLWIAGGCRRAAAGNCE